MMKYAVQVHETWGVQWSQMWSGHIEASRVVGPGAPAPSAIITRSGILGLEVCTVTYSPAHKINCFSF